MVLLLSYKMFMVHSGYHFKKTGIDDRKFFSDVFWKVYKTFRGIFLFSKKTIIIPVYIWTKHASKIIYRRSVRYIKNAWSFRGKPGTLIKKDGVASKYLRKILAQKKIIQKKEKKSFDSENPVI